MYDFQLGFQSVEIELVWTLACMTYARFSESSDGVSLNVGKWPDCRSSFSCGLKLCLSATQSHLMLWCVDSVDGKQFWRTVVELLSASWLVHVVIADDVIVFTAQSQSGLVTLNSHCPPAPPTHPTRGFRFTAGWEMSTGERARPGVRFSKLREFFLRSS